MQIFQNLIQQLSRMQWSDYLDIILVALLIYKLIPLFKTPSTRRIAVAVLGVIMIAWLTEALELHTLNWILSQVLAVGLLAVVILFQPELRRILDRLGSVRIKGLLGMNKDIPEMDAVISQTVAACEVLSRERVGALIVFARESRLDDYFKTGTRIDGQVSEQLIRNIFFPKAALHDGAMIIRDGRVAVAGCVLPLSESSRISADLGIRHRAGMGISEVSDAVVVIVSEETGTVSVAVGGMLKRHLASQTLERLLHNELCPKEDKAEQPPLQRLSEMLHIKKKEGNDIEK